MKKFKTVSRAGQNFLVIQGQKGQQISEREYYAIHTGQVPGLLRAELVKKGKKFQLKYNISGFVPLKEFLKMPLNQAAFAKLLGNILNNLKALQRAYYNYQFILMDINAAMIHPVTQQVCFVYVPITFYESGTGLKEFLLSIIQCCSFRPGENTDYVRDYINILNSGINFSVFDLEEYVKNISQVKEGPVSLKKCTHCGNEIQPNIQFCTFCGMKIEDLNANASHGIYDPSKNIALPKKTENAACCSVDNSRIPYSETLSGSFMSGAEKPFLAEQPNNLKAAYFYRVRTGEQIPVATDFFKIGKDPKSCTYSIADNPAVSRFHALVKQANGKWFITDLNSTNKTYINGQAILPNTEIEIYNGMNIKFANEEFIFYLY